MKSLGFIPIFLLFLLFSCADNTIVVENKATSTIELTTSLAGTEGVPNLEYSFRVKARNLPNVPRYEWSFDDGKSGISGTQIEVRRTFSEEGRYFVQVRLFDNESGRVETSASIVVNIRNSKPEIAMVLIPAGIFVMGDTAINHTEEPMHTVTISRPFLMGKFEITQKQWRDLWGINPSWFRGDSLPVEQISWYDAVDFCNRLSYREGLTPCYSYSGTSIACNFSANGYRLPTEAEWEYACRAGTKTDLYSGNLVIPWASCNPSDPPEPMLDEVAWHCLNADDQTHVVGHKKPNAFGLYDMHGNVAEWVWDWTAPYSGAALLDPTGPAIGARKIVRGGAWLYGATYQRSAYRATDLTPAYSSIYYGFRVVRTQ